MEQREFINSNSVFALPVIPLNYIPFTEIGFKIEFAYDRGFNRTICTLFLVRLNSPLGGPAETDSVVGIAECHHSDQFCKETGRKLALTRALQGLAEGEGSSIHGCLKVLRKNIWEAYRTRTFQGSCEL